jgi:hypothetical protein
LAEDFGRRLGVPSLTTRAVQDAYDKINELPRFSRFSYATPESNVTAQAPALGFNEASGVSRLWAKVSGSGNTGWTPIA